MTASTERRLLQIFVALACLVPLFAGGEGVLTGPSMVKGVDAAPADLDSHFRYLSGLLLGIGIAFALSIPRIEKSSTLFRVLGFLVVVGGIGRLLSLIEQGTPGAGHVFGLAMELLVTPALVLWQGRVARRCQAVAA
ncbi:MAG TPA: DUF4345 domain-containing protein [Allosphingosinicella sp.]|uniref:DUF4345 domain-containing protein n=1 Tax=Allosphingosinicella sp. TaxID=2823234 RepID=UPI002ED8910E